MTGAELRATALRWWHEGRTAVVVVTVVGHRGSVPRETGTRMLVTADAVLGTVGGGRLEWEAVAAARASLGAGDGVGDQAGDRAGGGGDDGPDAGRLPRRLSFALGPSLGQCCGGAVELELRRLADAPPQAWDAPPCRFVLQLHGAGHVGRAVAALAATLPCRVQWVDERDDGFDGVPPLPPHVERVATDAAVAEVADAAPGTHFAVMTHSHALDLEVVHAVLARGDFASLGLIGSASKRARFEHRLRARGIDDARLARLACPVGLPGVDGKEPEVIAVGVVAQLLQRTAPTLGGGGGGDAVRAGRARR